LRFEVGNGAKEVFILFGDRCDHRLFSKCLWLNECHFEA